MQQAVTVSTDDLDPRIAAHRDRRQENSRERDGQARA